MQPDQSDHQSLPLERYWSDGSGNFPPPKSLGATVSSSDFVSEETGVLRYDDATWETVKHLPDVQAKIAATSEERARRAGRVFAVSQEGYYTNDLLLGNDHLIHLPLHKFHASYRQNIFCGNCFDAAVWIVEAVEAKSILFSCSSVFSPPILFDQKVN